MRETWEGVFAQFAVERSSDETFLGQVIAYGAHPRDQYIYIAAIASEPGSGALIFAVAILIEYVFTLGGFRRVYMEVPGFNFEQFSGRISEYFPEDTIIPDRDWYNGHYWDVHLLGCPRDHWMMESNRLRAFVTRNS